MITEILAILFFILLTHYVFFILGINKGLSAFNNDKPCSKNNEFFVSVIIPFRNESENILNSLSCIESLAYPKNKFEVIYVNDASDDDSLYKLTSALKSGNIKVITLQEGARNEGYKKRAVKTGIDNSVGDIIVTTDADCIFKPEWLNGLLANFDEETAFVSGPVRFINAESFFAKLQTIEFAGLVLAGAGLIGIKKPVICNGANIAYRKSVFLSVNGFEDNMNIASGDDGFLMQKIADETNYKIKFCFNKEAIVETKPNKTILSFLRQRKRWAGKSPYYKDKLLVAKLGLIYLFYLSLFVLFISAFTGSKIIMIMLAVGLLAKFFTEALVMQKGKAFFNLKYGLLDFILAEIFQIVYIITLTAAGLGGNTIWKERKIKK
jgi:cellulose synthase/poly-beta-1,6-N-acetylglucosamine synthase-like glycosyltransferase